MRMRSALLAGTAALALAAPAAFAADAAPQVTDPSGDANFSANGPVTGSAPVGNQDYADVTSVLWAPVKKNGKTTAFTVKATLTGAPTPPAGTALVYRMLGQVAGDSTLFLGPVYYTTASSDPAQPQSALRDNLGADKTTRLTKIDLPKIEGSTITWTVPVSAVPKEFKLGTSITNLYFEVREIEDFRGQSIPSAVPVYGGATGLGVGLVDNGQSEASFQVG